MAVIDTENCVCSGLNLDVGQTLFLGCSVQSIQATAGWNSAVSSLDVILIEDNLCGNEKTYYSSQCLSEQTWNDIDPGFFGDPRWSRISDRDVGGRTFPSGSQYSSCTPENINDVLVRPPVNLEGVPAFFKLGTFEWCGIISDWAKDIDSSGLIKYRVKLVDPKIIMEKVNMIIGDYQGAVNCDPSCPNANLINVYGFMEFFGGVPSTAYAQQDFDCNPVDSEWGFYDSVANLTVGAGVSRDGLVFGTPTSGFGGSCWTEDGMPWSRIFFGLNTLVNKIPSVVGDGSGFDVFSPYGRVVFTKPSYFSNWSDASAPTNLLYGLPTTYDLAADEFGGLMPEDTESGCFSTLNYYYLDLSELTQVFDVGNFACGGDLPSSLDKSYRLSGTSMTVMEMIEQMSKDFGFDYYVDMVPVKNPSGATGETCTSIEKFIKLRIINKKLQGAQNNAICALTDFPQCQTSFTQGRELRTDATSRFVLGAHKQTIFQARQDINPDAFFTSPANDAVTLAGYTINSGANAVTASVSGAMDDMILPYMGVDQNNNILNTYIITGQSKISGVPDPSGVSLTEYCWELPAIDVSTSLAQVVLTEPYIRVCESEFRAALVSYDTWYTHVMDPDVPNVSQLGQIIRASDSRLTNATGFRLTPRDRRSRNPIDWNMPDVNKFLPLEDTFFNDVKVLYQWVQKYAQENLGSKWAVRVPFTACYPDLENQRTRISEVPTNDGGWTEVCEVLGLPNGNYADGSTTGFGYELGNNFELRNYFLTEDRKILPFVRFDEGVLKDTSRLPKDSFFFRWQAQGDLLAAMTTGTGVPVGAGSFGDVYTDTLTGMIYVHNGVGWQQINTLPVITQNGDPDTPNLKLPSSPSTPFLWHDKLTGLGYIVTAYTTTGDEKFITTIDHLGSLIVTLYVRATVETMYVFHDSALCYVPRVVISTPGPVFTRNVDSLDAIGGLRFTEEGAGDLSSFLGIVGGEDAWLPEQPAACMIAGAAIPMKHNEIHYGPWCNPSNPSWGGEFIQDDQFAPWNFGSYELMNRAGLFYSCAGRKDGQGQEIGNITVPGYPTAPLGVELGAINGLGAQYLTENRTYSTDTINETGADGNPYSFDYGLVDFGTFWQGNFGPNITNISVSINSNCDAQTTYSFRSYAPRQGGMDRKLLDRLQRANEANQRLIKRVKKLEQIAERLNAIR